jgi:hypothetical protein
MADGKPSALALKPLPIPRNFLRIEPAALADLLRKKDPSLVVFDVRDNDHPGGRACSAPPVPLLTLLVDVPGSIHVPYAGAEARGSERSRPKRLILSQSLRRKPQRLRNCTFIYQESLIWLPLTPLTNSYGSKEHVIFYCMYGQLRSPASALNFIKHVPKASPDAEANNVYGAERRTGALIDPQIRSVWRLPRLYQSLQV